MNREIDLESDARTHDAKKRKLDKVALQKMELREAIDALKKPNRTNAASMFMDEVESRSLDPRTGTEKARYSCADHRHSKTAISSTRKPLRAGITSYAVILQRERNNRSFLLLRSNQLAVPNVLTNL